MKLSNAKVLLTMLFIQLSTVNCQEGEELLRKRRGLYSPGRPGPPGPPGPPGANAQRLCNSTNDLKDTLRFQQGNQLRCQAIVVLSQ